MTYSHVHVSEVPDNPVVECTTASVLEVVRAVMNGLPGQPPATAVEREALRAASDAPDNAGTNIPRVVAGAHTRYGISLDVGAGVPADLSSLPEGTFLAVQGNSHDLPIHYQRWDPGFASHDPAPHCVAVFKLNGILTWCDPLAPWGPYVGEPIGPAVVAQFSAGLPGAQYARGVLRVPPPAPKPVTWTMHLAPGAQVEVVPVNTAKPPQITGPAVKHTWGSKASSAGCSAPQYLHGTHAGGSTCVYVPRGAFAKQWVHVTSKGVAITHS